MIKCKIMKSLKPMFRLVAVFFLAQNLVGCAHSVHQVHTSDFFPMKSIEQGDMVKASAEQFAILGFVDNTDYVNVAYRQLMQRCPNGALTGITTQLSTSLGFFSWTNKALMQGLCISVAKK